LGIFVAVIGYVAGLALLIIAVALLLGSGFAKQSLSAGTRPVEVILALALILPAALSIAVVCEQLFLRNSGTLLGDSARARVSFRLVLRSSLAIFAVQVPLYFAFPDVRSHLSLGQLLLWLPVALPMIFFQTAAEELVFRGFLQQQLGARFGNPLVWMVVPSVLFGALHYDPESFGDDAISIVIWAISFGVIAADLTARTGNLGAAIALHFCNNTFALLLFGTPGHMDGLALFVMYVEPASLAEPLSILLNSASLLFLWLGARIALRL
jgi:membrane protease YdiL (CAAX protease family)